MRPSVRFICVLFIFAIILSSCGNGGGKPDSGQTDPGTDIPQAKTEENKTVEITTETKAKPLILVRADGTPNCTVTMPLNASEETAAAVAQFVKDVEKKTGVELPLVDETSEIRTEYEIAVNATLGREPLAEQLQATPYTDYLVRMWDWHIMVTARSDKALSTALKRILFVLENLDEGFCVREGISLQASAILGERKTSVPLYDTENGKELPLYSVKNGYEVCIQETTTTEFSAYAEKLGALGFVKYSEASMSAGSASQGRNLSLTYTGEDLDVFLTWNDPLQTARIVFAEKSPLPESEKPTLTSSDTADLTIAQIGIGGLGMSYAIQLRDYSFILIDGGTNAESNITKLHDYILEKTPDGTQPRIACWIFTHADPDHIGAPFGFLQKYMGEIVLESVICNFPDCSVQNTSQNDETIGTSIFTLENLINRFYGSKVYTAHTGQTFFFKGLELEILFTEEDIYPKKVNSYNDTTLMGRFTFDNGKTFMMLGDSTQQTSQQLAATFGEFAQERHPSARASRTDRRRPPALSVY